MHRDSYVGLVRVWFIAFALAAVGLWGCGEAGSLYSIDCAEGDTNCDGVIDSSDIIDDTGGETGDETGGIDPTQADMDSDDFTIAEGDCNDDDDSIFPGATEIYYDGVDQNCDDKSDYDQDEDGEDSAEHGGTDCVDTDNAVMGCGTSATNAVKSCLVLHQVDDTLEDGVYWITPEGNTEMPFKAYCDMTTDDGGYTFRKVRVGNNTKTPAVEAECAKYGMRLFIPRSAEHLASAMQVATTDVFDDDDRFGNNDTNRLYLALMGIYPNENGSTCRLMPFNSDNPDCDWRAGDDNGFYVSDRTNINEPNGDNLVDHSMVYRWRSDNTLNNYNDERSNPSARRFICSTADKHNNTPPE